LQVFFMVIDPNKRCLGNKVQVFSSQPNHDILDHEGPVRA
jgi:hypothetical protein